MMKAENKWQLVKEKQEVLRKLTEEAWGKDEWELAALGERTLRTVDQSKVAADTLGNEMAALNYELGRLERYCNNNSA